MKKWYKLGGIVLASVLALASITACGKKNDEPNNNAEKTVSHTVSFETNGGSAVEAQVVVEGQKVNRPEAPEKAGFYFEGWFSDAGLTEAFDFETAVAADITLYASWVDASGSVTATFYTDDSTVHTTAHFADGSRISKPDDPVKEGFYFAGWFTAEGVKYKTTTKYSGEQKFYAKWLEIYTFEAEDTQLTGLDPDEDDTCSDSGNKLGQSYSGNVSGANLIGGCSCNASGDAYVTNLYYNGAFLEFVIESDKAVEDALLYLRLSAEFTTIAFTKDTFLVTVNGTKINYEPITIVGGTTDDLTSTSRTPMSDYAMGEISLVEGTNVVRLEVNNSEKQFATGTMDAAAPMIDAIKIYSDANLVMKKFEN